VPEEKAKLGNLNWAAVHVRHEGKVVALKLNRGRQDELVRAMHKAIKGYSARGWKIMHGAE
jgi:uncharacterized protein Veg